MPESDPRWASLAQRLQERLELERSLGVEYMPAYESPESRVQSPGSTLDPAPGTLDTKEAALAPIREQALKCTRCGLCQGRTNVVFGEGSLDTDLVFVGEGPGRDEDLQGRPFVGRAGKLLTDIIEKGLQRPRASVYICNIIKCRPPGNRDPKPEEKLACLPYLEKQLEIIQPKIIVSVGRLSANLLTEQNLAMGKLRGRWWLYRGTPLRAIYHTAYLLRQRNASRGRHSAADRATWEDLKAIMERLKR